MGKISLEDKWWRNEKIVAAGKDGRALWLYGLMYAHDQGTSGLLPRNSLSLLCGAAEVDAGVVERLTVPWRPGARPLWHECEEGWLINDYDKYNPEARKQASKPVDTNSAAHRLSSYLAKHVATYHGRDVKTKGWDSQMDLLLRRGPTEWASPGVIDPDDVRDMIDKIFENGDKSAKFSWADQIQSTSALRKHWVKLVNWRERLPATRQPNRVPSVEYKNRNVCPTCEGSRMVVVDDKARPCPDCR